MPAFLYLVVVDEFGIRLLSPTLRSLIQLVRENTYSHRDGDPFGPEERHLVLKCFPIEARPRNRGFGQPGDRDVVQDIIARKAFGLAVEDTRDHCQTARVVIEE